MREGALPSAASQVYHTAHLEPLQGYLVYEKTVSYTPLALADLGVRPAVFLAVPPATSEVYHAAHLEPLARSTAELEPLDCTEGTGVTRTP